MVLNIAIKQGALALLLCGVMGSSWAADAPLKTIDNLDVPRYMGRWYEIAKFPNWFQKKCISHTVAEYSPQANGQVKVLNRCRLADGLDDSAEGVAKQIGPSNSPKLQVRFAPSWLSLLPFVWGDYWVIDLDADYQLAAVSEPQREYLWVLSRTPQVDAKAYEALLIRLRAQGLNTDKLEMTLQ